MARLGEPAANVGDLVERGGEGEVFPQVPDLAVHQLYQALGDRQAETGAGDGGVGIIGAVELLENPLALLLSHADPLIGNTDDNLLAIRLNGHPDLTAVG